mmetsp:Transcript_36201/g.92463  ORF Transcript_36201/g.92463 Transcript_36201/m.92463 type:complete len:252 (+) Transcript_36201:1260-2015(+)
MQFRDRLWGVGRRPGLWGRRGHARLDKVAQGDDAAEDQEDAEQLQVVAAQRGAPQLAGVCALHDPVRGALQLHGALAPRQLPLPLRHGDHRLQRRRLAAGCEPAARQPHLCEPGLWRGDLHRVPGWHSGVREHGRRGVHIHARGRGDALHGGAKVPLRLDGALVAQRLGGPRRCEDGERIPVWPHVRGQGGGEHGGGGGALWHRCGGAAAPQPQPDHARAQPREGAGGGRCLRGAAVAPHDGPDGAEDLPE